MAALTGSIESFIKALMEEKTVLELKRGELARQFGCAPSQINYVLSTRFSPDRGYIVESRRGGSGYIRLVRVRASGAQTLGMLLERIGSCIDVRTSLAITDRLLEAGMLTERESALIAAGVSADIDDMSRAEILKNMVLQAFRSLQEE